MNRKKSILFFIGSPAIFCFSLSRQELSNKHTVAVRRKSNRRKYERPKHSTQARRSENTCRSFLRRIRRPCGRAYTGRNDMIRAGKNICRPSRHGIPYPLRRSDPARTGKPDQRIEPALPHSARVFRPAFLLESGTARSAEARDRFPVHGDTRRQNPDRANESVETRCRPISATARAAPTNGGAAP